MCVLNRFSRIWLCDPMDCSLLVASVHRDSPGKNTGVDCHFLLWGIFLIQGSNLGLPDLLHWKVGFLLVCFFNHWWHLGSPVILSYLLNLAALVTRVPSRKTSWLWQSRLFCSWVFKPFFQRTTSCPRFESQVPSVRELCEAVYPDTLQDLVMALY